MPYILNKYNGTELVVLQDGTLDTTTSLGLVGKNYVGYGEIQNENFLFLLENFAGINPPARPIKGQTWYDSANNKLNAYDGTRFIPVGSAIISETPPEITAPGSLWLKIPSKQLYTFTGTSWTLIGPEGVDGFGETRTKAAILRDTSLTPHAVLLVYVDGKVISIFSSESFEIYYQDLIDGFLFLVKGVTAASLSNFGGNLIGNSSTATKFETGRRINGILFDGTQDITITANTPGVLTRGLYLTGFNFNGNASTTWAVDASSDNIIGKVVARDTSGGFSAGQIIADEFVGPLSGNVTAISGTSTFYKIICNNIDGFTFSGISGSAIKLTPGKNINGVLFDGSQDITVTADAGTLTGVAIASTVLNSSLTSVGTLTNLSVQNAGIFVGNSQELQITVNSNEPTIAVTNGTGLRIKINDANQSFGQADFQFISSSQAVAAGGQARPTFVGDSDNTSNIGLPSKRFNNVYADTFNGTATNAILATTATNANTLLWNGLYRSAASTPTANTIAARDADGNIAANLFQGTATSAQYADLAENYIADAKYEPGTVLEFGGHYEVTLADTETTRVAGVVTTKPAYLMNSDCSGEHVSAIALQGRTPCKVIGPIRKGDILVSAGNGYAKFSSNPKLGTIIGKSLEDFNGNSGIIEVAVGRL